MNVLRHNEAADIQMLKALSAPCRVLFAALCATRIEPTYQRFCERTGRGDPVALRSLFERLWRDLSGDLMTSDEVQAAADRAMELVPSEDDGWDEQTQPYAEDVAAALAYAFRARLSGDPKEAAWAGRRVYEAADHFAGAMVVRTSKVSRNDEFAIVSHPVVQAELARQQRDLRDLAELDRAGAVAVPLSEMRARSEREASTFFQVK